MKDVAVAVGIVFVALQGRSAAAEQGDRAVEMLVDVVVLVVAAVGHTEDFVDIIAIDEPGLLVVAGIGFHEDLPLFAVIVASALASGLGVDLFYASGKGVVGVCGDGGGAVTLGNLDDTILVVVKVSVAAMVAYEVARGVVVAANLSRNPLGFFSQLQSNRKKQRHKYITRG